MRKFLLTLAVAVLAVGLVLPEVFAASFKFTGMYRYRGVSYDDADRDNTSEDGNQKADMLMRPRFTAVSEGGKVKAVWELDLGSGSWDATKTAPKVNRHYVQFALPGTKTHGANFAAQAVSRGATLVVSDRQGQGIIKKMGFQT